MGGHTNVLPFLHLWIPASTPVIFDQPLFDEKVPIDWYVGTSGYNFKEWKGPFYPDKMLVKDMLGF
jgi:hypothetical protein